MTTTPLLPPETVEHVLRAAGRAPSVHNSQPWRFVVAGEVVDLHADRTRQLAVLDPEGRQLHLSCGAALEHARVNARARGVDVEVSLLPDASDHDHLARLVLRRGAAGSGVEVALADAILLRRTHRGRFSSTRVPGPVLDRLRAAVAAEGAGLRLVETPDDLVELSVLLAHADAEQAADPQYVAELRHWADLPGSPDVGIGADVLDPTSGEGSSLSPRRFTTAESPTSDEPPTPEHPDVVVVVTPGDQPADWLTAGQALGALLLTAAGHGVLAQPLGQATDTPAYRQRLATALGLSGVPQLALRLGFPSRPAAAPHDARWPRCWNVPACSESVGA